MPQEPFGAEQDAALQAAAEAAGLTISPAEARPLWRALGGADPSDGKDCVSGPDPVDHLGGQCWELEETLRRAVAQYSLLAPRNHHVLAVQFLGDFHNDLIDLSAAAPGVQPELSFRDAKEVGTPVFGYGVESQISSVGLGVNG